MQAQWYKKLEREGFRDIEQFEPGNRSPNLKSWHSCYFQLRHDPETFQIKADYYYRAGQYLHSGVFNSETDRHVWKLHAEGYGVRQIAQILSKTGKAIGKDKINSIVRLIKKQMFRGETAPQKEVVLEIVWKQMNLFDETN